ncbi:MAG: PfaD family polyunsaturated fatty acid/polyketide biosynthesis protein [Pirellulales bacterium]|nr:PfaD family polyunsaturated fatty acid/polyketide biosynthesis protein [Pirellulales bacterium]
MQGWWIADSEAPSVDPGEIARAIGSVNESLVLVDAGGYLGVARGGTSLFRAAPPDVPAYRIVAFLPETRLESLGDPTFCADHGLRYPYVTGAMANGIGSAAIVEAMGQVGMLGFFGSAGLPVDRVEREIDHIQATLGARPYGINLINNPGEPDLENAIVDLYLRKGVRLIEASAFLALSLPLVRYRTHGIHRDANGRIVTPNQVIAKVSRVEVATKFFSPPPDDFLQKLLQARELTPEQVDLARHIPVAQDLTAEADSGGHTDNRPAITMIPTLLALRDRLQQQFGYQQRLRVGAGGGVGSPAAVSAALAMGAAYVLTGTINQACVESGTSDAVRAMLAQAEQADVAMGPAGDMFEMGVKVQVLKRGTLFAMRGQKLYDLYREYNSIEEIPVSERTTLEKQIFRMSLEEIWGQTADYFQRRDPRQVERASKDPKHKMALVFRWYLGQSSRWAITGEPTRQADYQIWCGPAIGSFNEWVKESCLEPVANRHVVSVAFNLLYGAAVLNRTTALRAFGVALPEGSIPTKPLPVEEIWRRIGY